MTGGATSYDARVQGTTVVAPDGDLGRQLDQHRADLTAYCYRMLASPFERIARTIEHSKPATGFAVPHDISKVFPPVGGHLAIALEARNGCHASSGARRARLELEHLELVAGWPPPVIEIAQKPAVFLVDTSREPRLQQLPKRVLQLVGQCSGRGGIEPARSGVSGVRGRAHEPIVL